MTTNGGKDSWYVAVTVTVEDSIVRIASQTTWQTAEAPTASENPLWRDVWHISNVTHHLANTSKEAEERAVSNKNKPSKQTARTDHSFVFLPEQMKRFTTYVPDDIAADGSKLELMRLALFLPVRCRSRATVSHSPRVFDKEFSPEGNEKSWRFPMCAWPAVLSGRDLLSMRAPEC